MRGMRSVVFSFVTIAMLLQTRFVGAQVTPFLINQCGTIISTPGYYALTQTLTSI